MTVAAVHPRGSAATPSWIAASVTLGAAIAVSHWVLDYVCGFPGLEIPGGVLIPLLVVSLFGGGWLAGRRSGPAALRAGFGAGIVATSFDLLALAGVLSRGDSGLSSASATTLVGFVVGGGVIAALGALWGARRPQPTFAASQWLTVYCWVVVAATFALIMIGGVVTSGEHGLAVPDWPATYQLNMFLFPREEMVAGIYYEHFHRLFAFFVGLLTLGLTFFLGFVRRTPRAWALGGAAVLLVLAQAVLGGLRVTMAENAAENLDNLASTSLRVVHGVTGQVFFALLVAVAAGSFARGRREEGRASSGSSPSWMTWVLLAVVGQLVLGALVRHVGQSPWLVPHILGAVAVVGIASFAGARIRKTDREIRALRLPGTALLHAVTLQFVLGMTAFFVSKASPETNVDQLVSTSHHVFGAFVLGLTAYLWTLTRPVTPPSP